MLPGPSVPWKVIVPSDVPSPAAPFDDTVAHLLGTCTVAAFAASVYVAATANTGWSRCSQYDRSALEAFALAP